MASDNNNMSVVIGAGVGVPVAVIVIAAVTVVLVIIIVIKNRGEKITSDVDHKSTKENLFRGRGTCESPL